MLAAGVAKHGQEQPAAGKGGHLIESGEVVAPQEGRRTKVPEDLAVRPCRFPGCRTFHITRMVSSSPKA